MPAEQLAYVTRGTWRTSAVVGLRRPERYDRCGQRSAAYVLGVYAGNHVHVEVS